uniref:COP9 signalosome complex subunit 3 n=1 Tax=Heterorhabditis bacteriophora TaxID=37862 RepID=A0A1I7W738_HETBA
MQFAIEGPSSLLALSLREKNSLWEFLEGKEKQPTRNRYQNRNALNKILIYLYLISSFYTNAHYLKGVMHPPDLGIAVPTSVRSFLPISTKRVCNTILLPLSLPTSVEARACLPSFLAQRVFRHIYGSHSIYVAFYRSGGELKYGKEIKLCASLCKMTFPNAQGLLKTFEVSFLISDASYIRTSEIEENVEKDYSLEELYRLLSTVQCELDGMKANPQGDRSEYIRKLSALERRMQRFHECITSKLGAETIDTQSISIDDESCDAVANVLAPYREEAVASSHGLKVQ